MTFSDHTQLFNTFKQNHNLKSQQSPVSDFFNYYTQYRTDPSDDVNTRFENLANHLKWKKKTRAWHRSFFNGAIKKHIAAFDTLLASIDSESPLSYFRVFVAEYGFVIDPTQLMATFNKLSKVLKWDLKRREQELAELQTLIDQYVGSFDLDKLSCMQHVIRRYLPNKTSKQINTKSKCSKILDNEIFVNIHDFATPGNRKHFLCLEELGEYTRDNNLWYPKAEAKDKKIFKVLLKRLRFWYPRN